MFNANAAAASQEFFLVVKGHGGPSVLGGSIVEFQPRGGAVSFLNLNGTLRALQRMPANMLTAATGAYSIAFQNDSLIEDFLEHAGRGIRAGFQGAVDESSWLSFIPLAGDAQQSNTGANPSDW
ncbi:MAG: hypothetical protein GXP62_14800 [Oligoflexia bacterium]|nr:hypothetical protein [Oligoflexia bacterium]